MTGIIFTDGLPWTPYEEKYAWWPTKIPMRDRETGVRYHKMIWFCRYWQRVRKRIYMIPNDPSIYEVECTLDPFDLLRAL